MIENLVHPRRPGKHDGASVFVPGRTQRPRFWRARGGSTPQCARPLIRRADAVRRSADACRRRRTVSTHGPAVAFTRPRFPAAEFRRNINVLRFGRSICGRFTACRGSAGNGFHLANFFDHPRIRQHQTRIVHPAVGISKPRTISLKGTDSEPKRKTVLNPGGWWRLPR